MKKEDIVPDYYNRERAGRFDKRAAMKNAVDAETVESFTISLTKTLGTSRKEQGLKTVHREFSLIKEVMLEKLSKRKVGAGIMEALLRKLKEAENNLVSVVSKS